MGVLLKYAASSASSFVFSKSCFFVVLTANIVLLYVSHSIPHYIMYVIYFTEQTSAQTLADSLVEELWNQVEALKKGYTGRMTIMNEKCMNFWGTFDHYLVTCMFVCCCIISIM